MDTAAGRLTIAAMSSRISIPSPVPQTPEIFNDIRADAVAYTNMRKVLAHSWDFQLFLSLLDADRFYGKFRQGVHGTTPGAVKLWMPPRQSRQSRGLSCLR
jgi:hypothetical protein